MAECMMTVKTHLVVVVDNTGSWVGLLSWQPSQLRPQTSIEDRVRSGGLHVVFIHG